MSRDRRDSGSGGLTQRVQVPADVIARVHAASLKTDPDPEDVAGGDDPCPDVDDALTEFDWDTFNADTAADAKSLDTDPDPSPNRGATRLRRYWTTGPGAAKIRWGTPHDFDRCVTQLGKYVKEPKGLCNVLHTAATGSPPGKGHKEEAMQPDVKTTEPWNFDTDADTLAADPAPEQVTGIEYKDVGAQVVKVDKKQGIVTAIVSVTGIEDRVKDIIEPGAYTDTLAERTPKGVWGHDWQQPISKTLEIRELFPGDPALPKSIRGGQAWPAEAGALLVKTQFNLLGERGRQALADVEFFGTDQAWSIGYAVPPGGSRIEKGVRHIKKALLFEYSPVLHGAAPLAATLDVKSAQLAYRALSADELARAGAVREGLESKTVDATPVLEPEPAPEPAEVEPEPEPVPEVDPEEKAAFPGAAPPYGAKKPKGDDDKPDSDDDSEPDAKGKHKFKKGDGGKCAVCHKPFPAHMKAQAGGEKTLNTADVWETLEYLLDREEKTVTAVVTNPDMPADEAPTGDDAPVESKSGRMLSGANAREVKAAYDALGVLLRKAGVLDDGEGKTEPGEPTVIDPTPETTALVETKTGTETVRIDLDEWAWLKARQARAELALP